MDKIAGHLEVGINADGDVVINHPNIQPDPSGAGFIVFSPAQARQLAATLLRKADEADGGIAEDIVRVLRVVEYVGPRALVERTIERSIHGTLAVGASGQRSGSYSDPRPLRISAATLGEFPERMAEARARPTSRTPDRIDEELCIKCGASCGPRVAGAMLTVCARCAPPAGG